MKHKKPAYIGITVIVVAIILLIMIQKNDAGNVMNGTANESLPVAILPNIAEGQGTEYSTMYDEVTAERQYESGKDVIMVAHQKTKNGQSYDYLVQFSSTADAGLLQMNRGTVFLGNNVKVVALNIINKANIEDGYEIEVVMEGRTLIVPVKQDGFLDHTNIRIK